MTVLQGVGERQERHFGGRSQGRTCPGPLAAPTGFEVQPPHGDDDLPRLDCYMEAGRIIATP